MKKELVMIIFIALILVASIFSFSTIKADDDSDDSYSENDSDDDNSGNSMSSTGDDLEDDELEIEIESEGRKLKIHAEGVDAEKIKNAIRERNRLRLNQSECPNDCSCDGSSIKCRLQNGTREMTITAGESGNIIVQVKNANASTEVELYKSEEGKVYAVFKNNETREIILPDEVQERIEERLRERVHLNNTNIILNEEGEYEVRARKRARLLWIIPVQERVRAQVDAETGEIIRQRSSWWGFLARDVRSE